MEKYTSEEISLINSLNKPINNIDMTLVNSIINKKLQNHDYEDLIIFLNSLYDFTKIPITIVERLISEKNKECISIFLENEDTLYFLTNDDKNKLKKFLNAYEVNIKLKKSFEFYYDLLFKQGVRKWKSIKINDDIIEYIFIKENRLIKIKLKEIKKLCVVSYINYQNYNLSKEEQILKAIDYINLYGFNIDINHYEIIDIV